MGMFDSDDEWPKPPPEIRYVGLPDKEYWARERWCTQTTFYDPEKPWLGNCTEACVATVLNIPLSAVSLFWPESVVDPALGHRYYWDGLRGYLESYGVRLQLLPSNQSVEAMYLACGPSERGCNHMCVYYDGDLLWDPHPSRKGLLEVTAVYALLPIDTASVRVEWACYHGPEAYIARPDELF